MKNFKPKYVDDKLNMRQVWQNFCLKLLSNIDKIEATTIREDAQARNAGLTFSERKQHKDKLKQCTKYREIIKSSAKGKLLELQDGDDEIILEKGWDYYFNYMNCNL